MNDGFKFECPNCAQRISATLDDVGTRGGCPSCDTFFVVPTPTGSTARVDAPSSAGPVTGPPPIPPRIPPLPPRTLPSVPPPLPPKELPPPKSNIFARVGMGLLVVLAGIVGKLTVREALKPSHRPSYVLPETRSIPPAVPSSKQTVSTSGGWARRDVSGVNLELPGTPRIAAFTVPAQMSAMVDHVEQYQLSSENYMIIVAHMRYRAGLTPSIDGVAAGAIQGMRDQPDVSGMSSHETEVTVDGLAARRFTARFRKSQYDLANDSLAVLRDRDFWMISVIGKPDEVPSIANRVLANVHLQP